MCLGLGAQPLSAQPFRLKSDRPPVPSPEATRSFQAKIAEVARALAAEPEVKRIAASKRQAAVEFIVGNMLFVATHEMGHALLAETKLPALAGEEQAADDFAVLTALKLGEAGLSDRVLIEAAKGWFVSSRRKDNATAPDFYAQHSFNGRRGVRIACLMLGADRARFGALADEIRLPQDRQRNCGWDYDTATRSWDRALAPFRRAADQPKAQIDVIYGAAEGALAAYAQALRNLQLLETIAAYAADRFAWAAPIVIEMRSCGEPGAKWVIPARRLHICYEMAQDLAQLYRDVGAGR
jgi:hypothetical protein